MLSVACMPCLACLQHLKGGSDLQVIGDWVAAHTQDEVLAAMAAARVPSGQLPLQVMLLLNSRMGETCW